MASQKQRDRRDVEFLFLVLALASSAWWLAVRYATANDPLPPPGPGDNASVLYKLATHGRR